MLELQSVCRQVKLKLYRGNSRHHLAPVGLRKFVAARAEGGIASLQVALSDMECRQRNRTFRKCAQRLLIGSHLLRVEFHRKYEELAILG
jgi:hypothetical protein